MTHALQSGSPAINRGDPAAPPQDQRGYGRAGLPDVGAFEVEGVSPSILGNISTRAFVQTEDNVMIGGFIVQGSTAKRVILPAIGPELTQYGVPNVLADPTLEVHDGTGGINGDRVRDIQDSGHTQGDPRESAIIANLSLGNYTGIVRGKNIIVGVTLVEVYDLE